MSKVKGACGAMVGCRLEAGFQALKRTPATASPARPVGCIGNLRPLQLRT